MLYRKAAEHEQCGDGSIWYRNRLFVEGVDERGVREALSGKERRVTLLLVDIGGGEG